MIEFDIPKEKSSIIKVFGVGGGGSNAVSHMYNLGIEGVNYVICNTDIQALEMSEVPNKIQLGSSLSGGLGAGNKPEIGREATEESIDKIEDILQANTKMVFITAGMGGGTGTGGAPVVARLAKDMGILTVGIVTTPFSFEGKKRLTQADEGIQALKNEVDALLIISNDKLREIHGNLKMSEAFGRADDILTVAAKGIAEIITKIGYINVDFEDVNTVMRDSGVALMGIGHASGEERAIKAVDEALSSPLLNDNNIIGAKSVLLNISYGKQELEMDEMSSITDYIIDAIGIESENLIWGLSEDENLDDEVRVTLIATGFQSNEERKRKEKEGRRVVHTLNSDDDMPAKPAKKETVKEEPVKPYLKQNETKAEVKPDRPSRQFTFEFQPLNESQPIQKQEINDEPECSTFDEKSAREFYSVEEEPVEPVSNATPVTNPFQLNQSSPQQQASQPSTEQNAETNNDVQRHNQEVIKASLDQRLQRLQSFQVKRVNEQKPYGDGESEEYVPAYKRQNIQIDTTPKSDQSNVSKYSLGENNGNFNLGKNSYLHDNVD